MSLQHFLGYKKRMTQTLDATGKMRAVTVIGTDTHSVTQVKTVETDGYTAVQVGFDIVQSRKVNKAQIGHMADMQPVRHMREFPGTEVSHGDQINPLTELSIGTPVSVAGISKGKGFQGVVKRYNFKGDKRTHGRKHSERKAGSIGGGGRAGGRVAKGMRMAGRMGNDRVTVKGLEILYTNLETKELFVSGAVPGRKGTLLEISVTKK